MAEPTDISLPAFRDGFVDEKKLLACIHCGLCLPACPTHVISGLEMPSPRGRLYLMRSVVEGRMTPADDAFAEHQWSCLVCRACETACPSGVEFGYLMEETRERLNETRPPHWFKRYIYTTLLSSRAQLRLLQGSMALATKLGLASILQSLGRSLARALPKFASSLRLMPDQVQFPKQRPEIYRTSHASPRGSVGILLGCVGDVFTSSINDKTIDILNHLGYDVHTIPSVTCCGALGIHAGFRERSLELAEHLMSEVDRSGVDLYISNIAGCGAMLKDYEKLFERTVSSEAAIRFRSRVRDVSEFLYEECSEQIAVLRPALATPTNVGYQAACHLYHAQKITDIPMALLLMIGNVNIVPLKENELCCGSAGSYNIEHPKESEELLERKLNIIRDSSVEIVATGNAGCLMQLRKGLRESGSTVRAMHTIEIVHEALLGASAERS